MKERTKWMRKTLQECRQDVGRGRSRKERYIGKMRDGKMMDR